MNALIRQFFLLLIFAAAGAAANEGERDATQIVRDAVDHWRGLSSESVMTMVIHRPDWERSMKMRAWTKGDERFGKLIISFPEADTQLVDS